ncbi:MAG: hypothetical protein M0O94_04315 [Bacteroidales bacterium]|nr:hypothetical protein [Bacteroidales bacterium]MDD2324329.1 hypothetical protein [Bacteroidales bacterium]MDD3961020.1 hypothetical protein [Bacteroidales bacterium]MDY0286257.1 hypothetical protein [Bacteroidales bacterium]
MFWKTRIIISTGLLMLITACDPCQEADAYQCIEKNIKALVPDQTITSFTLISQDGFAESYRQESWYDTIEAFEPDRCGNVFRWDRMGAMYRSTLNNDHNVEFRLDALNNTQLTIGINYKQQIAWDFKESSIIASGYDNPDYPEATYIAFHDTLTTGGRTWEQVLEARFSDSDINAEQIKEVLFAAHHGIIWYRLKNGVEYFRVK